MYSKEYLRPLRHSQLRQANLSSNRRQPSLWRSRHQYRSLNNLRHKLRMSKIARKPEILASRLSAEGILHTVENWIAMVTA